MINPLFERLSLQAHLRRILEQYPDSGWAIIQAAVERELDHTIIQERKHVQEQ